MKRVRVPDVSVLSAERFTKRVCFDDPQVLVFVLTFSPGQVLPPHRHPGSSVVLYACEGSGEMAADGNASSFGPGDTLLVTGEEELSVRNTGETPLVLLVSLSPNPTNKAFARELG